MNNIISKTESYNDRSKSNVHNLNNLIENNENNDQVIEPQAEIMNEVI